MIYVQLPLHLLDYVNSPRQSKPSFASPADNHNVDDQFIKPYQIFDSVTSNIDGVTSNFDLFSTELMLKNEELSILTPAETNLDECNKKYI